MNPLARFLVLCGFFLALLAPAAQAGTGKLAPARSAKSAKPVAAVKAVRSVKAVKALRSAKSANKTQVAKRGAAQRPVSVAANRRVRVVLAPQVAQRPSYGVVAGLHDTSDPLDLKSSVAYVIDQDTREVLVSKNDQAVLPIASLTKLMTALIVKDLNLPLDERIVITQDDVDTEKGSRSRLRVGTELSRGELLHLALMSSENRAAHALGRSAPGGMATFVAQMNNKARELGMRDTRFVEPTGLSSKNQSSAQDLAKLVNIAHADATVREYSTWPKHLVEVGDRTLQYNNTNRLVNNPNWEIGLQKTGYIAEAGRCLVMQTTIAGRNLIMVFLDSAGKLSRLGDAERVRSWIETVALARTPLR